MCIQLGQHKFGKRSCLLTIVSLEWDGGGVTNHLACTRLDWEAFALRSTVRLESKGVILLSFQIFIRIAMMSCIESVVVFTTREGEDL